MIQASWGQECVPLGVVETSGCPECEGGRVALLRYRFFALFWVFGIAWGREFLLACPNCPVEEAEAVPAERLGELQHRARVPFMRQFGLALLVAAVVVIGILSSAG